MRSRVGASVPSVAGAAVVTLALLLSACGSGASEDAAKPAASPSPSAPRTGDTAHTEEGSHAEPTSTVPATPLRAGERFTELGMPGGSYRPSAPAAGKDDYHCFLLDPDLGGDAFVTGAEVLPGVSEQVHHAILFRVEPAQVAAAERADAATPAEGWTCFGGTGIETGLEAVGQSLNAAPWLAAWAPGGGESVFGDGVGAALPAGGRIILQVHYNLREGSAPDDTAVKLRVAPASKRLEPLETMLLPAPVELPCPAGVTGVLCERDNAVFDLVRRFGQGSGRTVAGLQLLCDGNLLAPRAGPTQRCDRTVREALVVRAVAGHMHLLGRSIKVELNPGTARARTLLDRELWDFDNQRATPLPRPARVDEGDVLRVTCTHDASLRDQLPELADEAPRYVTWGEGTSDEMCLGIVLYTKR